MEGYLIMRNFIFSLIILFMATDVSAGMGKAVTYKINDQFYEGYYVTPAADAPLIFLIHDWDGLTGYEIKRSNMLAEKGFAVFAMDLFGLGIRPTEIKDKRQHTGELYKDREKLRALMDGALKFAEKQGANIDNAVAAGYCFGGAAVLEWARSGRDLKGFVTFHGGLKTPQGQDYTQAKGEILILHGTADSAIPMDVFAQLAKELEAAQISHEMITYGGAKHAFTVFESDRYQEKADRRSWKRFMMFLDQVLKN